MYFLRWIAGYPILIILLVTALYAIYNKDSLTHWFNGNEVAEEVSHEESAAQVAVHDTTATTTQSAASQATAKSESEVVAAIDSDATATTDKSGSWLDRFKRKNPAIETVEDHAGAAVADTAHQPARAEAVEIDRSGSWLDRFKRKNIVAETQETTPEHAGTAAVVEEAEKVVTEQVAVVEEKSSTWLDAFKREKPQMEQVTSEAATEVVVAQESTEEVNKDRRSGSWLDMFKRDKAEPAVDAAVVTPAEAVVETTVVTPVEPAPATEAPLAEVTATEAPAVEVTAAVEEKTESGSWLDAFKRKDADSSPETVVETVTETASEVASDVATTAVAAAETVKDTVTEEVEKDTGSWLDVFKREKSGTEQAVETVTETAATAEAEVATAEAETEATTESESGSWLDIFKRKSSPAEPVADEAQAQPAETAEAASAVQQEETAAGDNYDQNRSESLRLAREAYWNRDYDAAAAIYQNMTKAEPENMELLGEYGNFMLQAGRMSAALDIYERIANVLIKENRAREVQPLLNFIGNRDPRRADELARKLNNIQQSNK